MGKLGWIGGFETVTPLRIDRVTNSITNSEGTRQWIYHPRKPSISSSHLSELPQKVYCEDVKLKNNAQQQIDERSTN